MGSYTTVPIAYYMLMRLMWILKTLLSGIYPCSGRMCSLLVCVADVYCIYRCKSHIIISYADLRMRRLCGTE